MTCSVVQERRASANDGSVYIRAFKISKDAMPPPPSQSHLPRQDNFRVRRIVVGRATGRTQSIREHQRTAAAPTTPTQTPTPPALATRTGGGSFEIVTARRAISSPTISFFGHCTTRFPPTRAGARPGRTLAPSSSKCTTGHHLSKMVGVCRCSEVRRALVLLTKDKSAFLDTVSFDMRLVDAARERGEFRSAAITREGVVAGAACQGNMPSYQAGYGQHTPRICRTGRSTPSVQTSRGMGAYEMLSRWSQEARTTI